GISNPSTFDPFELSFIRDTDLTVMVGMHIWMILEEQNGKDFLQGLEQPLLVCRSSNQPGGLTTLIDMPLNSFPSTVSEETFELEVSGEAWLQKTLAPENAFNRSALEGLLKAGVLGLNSFMCPSGINDFPMTNADHIKEGLSVLAKYGRPLLVHAEIEQELEGNSELELGR
ncbi:Allantoinase, partial [Actinidia chinensis var. chinensis]